MTSLAHDFARPAGIHESGLSMVELLVTVVILGALMAGLAQLVVTNSQNATATGTLARIADTGRTAVQLLSTDIRRAGFLGGNIDNALSYDMISGSLPAGSPTLVACELGSIAWASRLGQPLVGINEPTDSSAIPYDCIKDNWLRGDVLTVRYTPTPAIADDEIDDMLDDRPYLRATMVEGRMFLGKDKGNGSNVLIDPSARNYNIAAHTYYVGPTGRECQGEAIPALFRARIGDDGFPVSEELLAGVENLQFRYLVNNRYFDADEVPLLTSGAWPPVAAVEITVLVRAECPEVGFDINRTFEMGDASYTPEDEMFRRQVFTTTVQLRN